MTDKTVFQSDRYYIRNDDIHNPFTKSVIYVRSVKQGYMLYSYCYLDSTGDYEPYNHTYSVKIADSFYEENYVPYTQD